jgi:copper transport protein
VALAVLLSLVAAADAHAHAALVASDPAAGAALGDSPTAVRLTFTEEPEPELSSIEIRDSNGAKMQTGTIARADRDARTLVVRVKPLPRGIYTVAWRVVSAVDAHATAGAYDFGVRADPGVAARDAGTSVAKTSRFEIAARWIFLTGLVLLIGAAAASAGCFGSSSDVVVAAVGWGVTAVGLVLLFEAQRRVAGVSLSQLLDTAVGVDLVWRAVAVGAAGYALLVAVFLRPPHRALALGIAGLAATAAVAAHVVAGHAAAGSARLLNVAAQWAHVTAVGVWLGGLAALLIAVRGDPSAAKAAAIRRFSTFAGVGLIVVLGTGAVRSIAELSGWSDLYSTGYGRAVAAKIALIGLLALLGASNRWRSVPRAATDLRPLRRTGRLELAVALTALAVAAVLGSLAPPAAGRQQPGFDVSGTDFATTVRVRLTTASTQPGPNRFVVRAVDYDSGSPVEAGVSLRFSALDDPDVPPTTLVLRPDRQGAHVGTGSNVAFDGRWRIAALVARGGEVVRVPLEVDVEGPPQFLSVLRVPGRPPAYTVDLTARGAIRVSPRPERPGRSQLRITVYDVVLNERTVDRLVVTARSGDRPTRQLPVRRLSRSTFVADAVLAEGQNRIAVIAGTPDGTRIRGVFDLDVQDAEG